MMVQNKRSRQTDNIGEIKRIIPKLLRNWPLFLIFMILSLTVGFLINRYTPRIYSINSSILIKDDQDVSGTAVELLYGNQLFNNSRNLNNEAILLESFPLIRQVLAELNYDKVFYKEGNVRTSEAFTDAPAKILLDSTSSNLPYNQAFIFNFNDDNTFSFYSEGSEISGSDAQTYKFYELIEYRGLKFRVIPNSNSRFRRNSSERKYIFKLLNLDALTNVYRSRLIIRPVSRDASILALSINGSIPEKEVQFQTKLIETYIQQGIDDKSRNASKTIDFIDHQLTDITDSLFSLESEIEQFKGKTLTTDISQEGIRLYTRIEEIESDRAALITRLNYYDYLIDYIKNNQGSTNDLVVPSSMGIQDPVLNTLISELVRLQLERESLIRGGSGQNQYISLITQQIEDLKINIIENVENLKGSVSLTKNEIELRINKLQSELALLPKAEREFINIKRVYDLSESLYLFLMEKRAEAEIAKASTSTDIKLIDPPQYSKTPISPQTERNLLVAVFLGLALPVFIVVIKNFINNKVQSKEDIDKMTDIPFLGVIGHKLKDSNLIVKDRPKSAVSESFRSVRSNLQFFTSNSDQKVFLITSSISGEGKTFASINLGLVFSLSGKNTVLVGADLRKPKIYMDFQLHNDFGLSNYLAGTATLDQIVQSTGSENFEVISGGPVPPNPSELLMSEKMNQLMEQLKSRYHYIIMDTPPVGLVTDAFILMKYSNHNIYMVRHNYTPKETLSNIQEMFEKGKVDKISILFNDVRINRYGYGYGYGNGYGYSYGYGNGYYDEEHKKPSLWHRLWNQR